MFLADPASFMLATMLVGLIIAALLFASHVGLGDEAPPIRLWIAGDMVLTGYRALFLLQPHALGPECAGVEWVTPSVAFLAGTFMLVMGVALHAASLARLADRRLSPKVLAASVLSVPAMYAAAAASIASIGTRMTWLLVVIAVVNMAMIFILRPIAMRYRGTKILAATLIAATIYNVVTCIGLIAHPPASLHRSGPVFPPLSGLLVDFAVSLLMTISLMLTLQERLRARIIQISVTDPLTGLLNRRGAIPLLEAELSRTLRYGRPLSIALLDLDHFKRINDTLGHAAGDEVLVGFARRVEALKRQSDVFARWGGEEFLIALPETECRDALKLLERIRAAVSEHPLAPQLPIVTVSCGISAIDPGDAEGRLESLLDAADRSLYSAKRHRNRVVAAAEVTSSNPMDSSAAHVAIS